MPLDDPLDQPQAQPEPAESACVRPVTLDEVPERLGQLQLGHALAPIDHGDLHALPLAIGRR